MWPFRKSVMSNVGIATVVLPESILKESAYPAHAVVSAVNTFKTTLIETGRFRREELPLRAIQAANADYYVGQIENGGHSQFIGNSGDQVETNASGALAAFQAAGADKEAQILVELLAWLSSNKGTASSQTGFNDDVPSELKALDERFFKLGGSGSKEANDGYPRLAAWILQWGNLEIVPDAEWQPRLRALCDSNPDRERRQRSALARHFRYQTTDPAWVATSLMLQNSEVGHIPREIPRAVALAFAVPNNPEGDSAILVYTSSGRRYLHLDERTAKLYEYVEQGFEQPRLGSLIAEIDRKRVNRRIEQGIKHNAAEAIELLFSKFDPTLSALSVMPHDDIFFQGEVIPFYLAFSPNKTFLIPAHEKRGIAMYDLADSQKKAVGPTSVREAAQRKSWYGDDDSATTPAR